MYLLLEKLFSTTPVSDISANDWKGAACTQMESSMCAPQSQKLGASGRDHVARWTLKCHFGAKSWREMTRGLAGVWCTAVLDSAAVERQLLLPSARRPGLRSTTAGLPPAPQERAKARVWASSASRRDARVDAVTPARMTVAAFEYASSCAYQHLYAS